MVSGASATARLGYAIAAAALGGAWLLVMLIAAARAYRGRDVFGKMVVVGVGDPTVDRRRRRRRRSVILESIGKDTRRGSLDSGRPVYSAYS